MFWISKTIAVRLVCGCSPHKPLTSSCRRSDSLSLCQSILSHNLRQVMLPVFTDQNQNNADESVRTFSLLPDPDNIGPPPPGKLPVPLPAHYAIFIMAGRGSGCVSLSGRKYSSNLMCGEMYFSWACVNACCWLSQFSASL